jgi:hypothetical protein
VLASEPTVNLNSAPSTALPDLVSSRAQITPYELRKPINPARPNANRADKEWTRFSASYVM